MRRGGARADRASPRAGAGRPRSRAGRRAPGVTAGFGGAATGGLFLFVAGDTDTTPLLIAAGLTVGGIALGGLTAGLGWVPHGFSMQRRLTWVDPPGN